MHAGYRCPAEWPTWGMFFSRSESTWGTFLSLGESALAQRYYCSLPSELAASKKKISSEIHSECNLFLENVK